MKTFLNWWKVWGQVWGFVGLVAVLTITFESRDIRILINETPGFGLLWIATFFGGCYWYVWQMKIHGWRLPKDIKDTH
jgi:frataxin-like iron-binding protein CyaY